MDDDQRRTDEMTRFAALRAESLDLIESTKGLVGEMRALLEDCKRRRPAVAPSCEPLVSGVQAAASGKPAPRKRRTSHRRINRPR